MPQAPGTACATLPVPCAAAEACCLPGGTCADVTDAACVAQGGTPQGPGTTCALSPCAGARPGWVADGAARAGTPLTVRRSATPPQLDLAWGASCSASHVDYAIYEGVIGTYYSHVPLQCSTADATSATISPSAADSRYYLITPVTASAEGSLGVDSFGVERPQAATSPCHAAQDIGCP